MRKALIKLAFRQLIDSSSEGTFEKDVFHDSYHEFLMQVQTYNQAGLYTTFGEVVAADPKAYALHYKVGFSVGLYVNSLNHQIPGLRDSLEQLAIPFATHQFAIIDSDIRDKTKHKISITYTTDTLTLLDSVGEYLLLSFEEPTETGSELKTFFLKLQPNLSIVGYTSSKG